MGVTLHLVWAASVFIASLHSGWRLRVEAAFRVSVVLYRCLFAHNYPD